MLVRRNSPCQSRIPFKDFLSASASKFINAVFAVIPASGPVTGYAYNNTEGPDALGFAMITGANPPRNM